MFDKLVDRCPQCGGEMVEFTDKDGRVWRACKVCQTQIPAAKQAIEIHYS